MQFLSLHYFVRISVSSLIGQQPLILYFNIPVFINLVPVPSFTSLYYVSRFSVSMQRVCLFFAASRFAWGSARWRHFRDATRNSSIGRTDNFFWQYVNNLSVLLLWKNMFLTSLIWLIFFNFLLDRGVLNFWSYKTFGWECICKAFLKRCLKTKYKNQWICFRLKNI